jgi:hypothetical protein
MWDFVPTQDFLNADPHKFNYYALKEKYDHRPLIVIIDNTSIITLPMSLFKIYPHLPFVIGS